MSVGERSESYSITGESKKKDSSVRSPSLHSSKPEVLKPFRLGVSVRRGRRRFGFKLPASSSPFRQASRSLRMRNPLDQSE